MGKVMGSSHPCMSQKERDILCRAQKLAIIRALRKGRGFRAGMPIGAGVFLVEGDGHALCR